jgi:hypothetical protein
LCNKIHERFLVTGDRPEHCVLAAVLAGLPPRIAFASPVGLNEVGLAVSCFDVKPPLPPSSEMHGASVPAPSACAAGRHCLVVVVLLLLLLHHGLAKSWHRGRVLL